MRFFRSRFPTTRTSSNSLAAKIAKKLEIFTLERDIFIDNNLSKEGIFSQLQKVESIADKYGKKELPEDLRQQFKKIADDIIGDWSERRRFDM